MVGDSATKSPGILRTGATISGLYSTPLTRSHQLTREAKRLARKGRYEEAIRFHLKAADELRKAAEETENRELSLSLSLQSEEQFKQEKIIKHRLKVEEQRKVMAEEERRHKSGSRKVEREKYETGITGLIYERMDENDSLLSFLYKTTSDDDGLTKKREVVGEQVVKYPKSEQQVIEELQVSNSRLRDHIELLINELEYVRVENTSLRGEVSELRSKLGELGGGGGERAEVSVEREVEKVAAESGGESSGLPPLDVPVFHYDKYYRREEGVGKEEDSP